MFLKIEQKVQDTLAAGTDEVGHHGPLSFLGDQPARFDSAQVLAGRGRLQPALVCDLQQGEAGLIVDQLQDPDPMLVGKGFRDDGQPGQGIGLMDEAHEGLNFEKLKRMRSKSDIFSAKTSAAFHGKQNGRGRRSKDLNLAIQGKLNSGANLWS